MKSRYFSIPGLLVDVTEIVGVRCATHMSWIVYRNGAELSVPECDAKSIQHYTEEYEQYQMDAVKSLAHLSLPDFLTSGPKDA